MRTVSALISLVTLFLSSAHATIPGWKGDTELSDYPIIVVARWDGESRWRGRDIHPERTLIVERVIRGDIQPGEQVLQCKQGKWAKEDPGVMDTLGWLYFKKGLYDSAVVELEESMGKQPENATIRYHLGMAYFEKGEHDRAKTHFEAALNLDKDFKEAGDIRQRLSTM